MTIASKELLYLHRTMTSLDDRVGTVLNELKLKRKYRDRTV
jgi:hypothetical protein